MSRSELEGQALEDARHVLADIAATIKTAVIVAIPLLIRGVCVGAAVIGIAYALPACWYAFGGDVPALIPAVVVGVLPLAAALLSRRAWGGLLLAGAVTLVAGAAIESVPASTRAVLLMATIGGLIFYLLKSKGHDDGEQ